MNPMLLSLILSLLAIPQGSKPEVVLQRHWPALLWQKVVIPEPEFTTALLKERFLRVLRDKDPRLVVLHLEVFIDKEEANGRNMKLRSDVSYEVWRDLYRDYEKGIPPSAELLMINGNAAMRMRDRDGSVRMIALQGSNPFIIHGPGGDFNLLHLAIEEGTSTYALEHQTTDTTQIFLCFITGTKAIDITNGKAIAMKLRKDIGLGEVEVRLSSDPWFITDSSFPIVSPYAAGAKPPTEGEYQRAPEILCTADAQVISCSKP
jgi:hypothetical protein